MFSVVLFSYEVNFIVDIMHNKHRDKFQQVRIIMQYM